MTVSSSPSQASFVGIRENWIIPKDTIPLAPPDKSYDTATKGENFSTVSPVTAVPERMFDQKTGLDVLVLNTPKNPRAIDQTEGILSKYARKLDKEGIEPTDLVKRAWKTSE